MLIVPYELLISPRLIALTALLAFAGSGLASAQSPDRLDRALREGKKSGKAQRVILKAKPGYEAWARQMLASKGKKIDAELTSIGAFAVEMSAAELAMCCESTSSNGCSEGTVVTPSAAPARVPGRRHRRSDLHRARRQHVLGTLGSPEPLGGLGVRWGTIPASTRQPD